MPDHPTHVIVGAGLAGAKAAEALREEGFDGRIVLIGDEPEPPYERPPLSKDYLRGESSREDAHVHPAGWYDEHADRAAHVDTASSGSTPPPREVALGGGESARATTACCWPPAPSRARLSVPGADLAGVHYLRDVERLRRDSAPRCGGAPRVVMIGAGWIGAEVAASARAAGRRGDAWSSVARRAARAGAGPRGRRGLRATIHRDHGVDLRTGAGVEAFEGADRGRARPAGRRARRWTATSWWSASAWCPGRSWPRQAGLRDRQRRSGRRRGWRPARPACSRRATWPTRRTPSTGGRCASSTGPTRCTSPRPPRARCSARRELRPRCPTSTPTSTTSGWSTSGYADGVGRGRLPGRPGRAASSSRSGSTTGRVVAGDERERLGPG